MAMERVRVGIIGSKFAQRVGGARRPHSGLESASEFEITAVSTSCQETADETAKFLGGVLQSGAVASIHLKGGTPTGQVSRSRSTGATEGIHEGNPSAQTSMWPSNSTRCLTRSRRHRISGSATFLSHDRPTA
jgi:hypothetical protein